LLSKGLLECSGDLGEAIIDELDLLVKIDPAFELLLTYPGQLQSAQPSSSSCA
jgi:hypothetical protein